MYVNEFVEEQTAELEQDLLGYCGKIRNLASDREAITHAEILAFSLLDSLGFIVDPDGPNGGGMRVRSFMEKFCKCEVLERYSVPALLSALPHCDDQTLGKLRDHCQHLFNQHWEPDSLPSINLDLKRSEIIELVKKPEDVESVACKPVITTPACDSGDIRITLKDGTFIELEKFKHSRMLAGKRNAITHQ